MNKYCRITSSHGGSYVQPYSDIRQALDGELDGLSEGEKLTVEFVDITDEEYRQLPEFKGH
jgi:hypothetical protein